MSGVVGPPSLAPLRLKGEEVQLFTTLFDLLDQKRTGKVTGKQVSSVFIASELPKPVLAEIWNIASRGNPGPLSKDGFFVGCRLVAIAQKGLPVAKQSLVQFTGDFQGFSLRSSIS
jgi:hypothetical protein